MLDAPLLDAIPTCLVEAYAALEADKAWVGCMVHNGTIQTIAAPAKLSEVRRSNLAAFTLDTCHPLQRASFLMGALKPMTEALA
jgi:hypothetical protein